MKIYIECRNCNEYLKIKKETNKYKCTKCGIEEDLVVIDKKERKEKSE